MRYVPTTFSVTYRSRWFGYRFGEDKSQIRDGNGGSYKARQSERGAQAAFGTRRLRLRSSLTLLESFGRKAAALCHLVESSIALTTSTLEIRQGAACHQEKKRDAASATRAAGEGAD